MKLTQEEIERLQAVEMRKPSRYRRQYLRTYRCTACGNQTYYQVVRCTMCGSSRIEEITEASKTGSIDAYLDRIQETKGVR